jgi:hypothetical protein
MKNWRCKVFGHKLDEFSTVFYYVDRCYRCSEYGAGCTKDVYDAGWREWIKVKWWYAGLRARNAWIDYTRWFRRCGSCGLRFGKHDGTVEHLPF